MTPARQILNCGFFSAAPFALDEDIRCEQNPTAWHFCRGGGNTAVGLTSAVEFRQRVGHTCHVNRIWYAAHLLEVSKSGIAFTTLL